MARSFKILILHKDHSFPLIQSSFDDSKPASIEAPFQVTICGSKSFGELIISICPLPIKQDKQSKHSEVYNTNLHSKLVEHLKIFCSLTKHMLLQI